MVQLKKIILTLVGVMVIALFMGQELYAQNRNLASGSFNAAGVPGATNNTANQNDQQLNGEGVPVRKPSFTIPRYFKALAHKDSMKISHMFFGSAILPGTAQIYNEQYWKLPVVYGCIGGFVGGAVAFNSSYQSSGKQSDKNWRNAMIAGAALTYYGSILDGVISYKSPQEPLPARATLYSALCPGLGQAYNGDYWKIPIFYGGLVVSGYCWSFNQKQYKRYKNMYIEAMELGDAYDGFETPENMIWYRDKFRRYRDYSIIATVAVYVLNIIDANVFAHFNNFDVSDDISFNVEPAIIEPVNSKYAVNSFSSYTNQAVGLQMNLKF